MVAGGWLLATARIFLIFLGGLLVYLGWKSVLEPMVMIPMGLGMIAINCGTLIMPDGVLGNLFLDPMLSDTDELMNVMQIDFLQPVYTLTFSNGLIACFVFMGIGTLLDVGFLLQKPFASLFLALCAELGTFLTLPIASAIGLNLGESASVALQWAGWIWRGTAVWDKGNSRPQKGRFRQQAEYIVWGSNGDMPISRPVPCLPGVFKYGNPQSRIHLTEKPLQLMRDIVKITEPGGHILDPFAGSGTTVLAAVQEGYTATGIEVTDTYAELARERIRKELACAA